MCMRVAMYEALATVTVISCEHTYIDVCTYVRVCVRTCVCVRTSYVFLTTLSYDMLMPCGDAGKAI